MSAYTDAPSTVAEARWLLGLPAWNGCTHGDPWICDCEETAAREWWDGHDELRADWCRDLATEQGTPVDDVDEDAAYDAWYAIGWPELVR